MIVHRGRCAAGADEGELIEVEIDRQVHLPIGPLHVGGDEFGLHAEELVVKGDLALADVVRLQVGDVAMTVDIARFPDPLTVRIDEGDVEPQFRLGAQRAGGEVVTLIEVGELVLE